MPLRTKASTGVSPGHGPDFLTRPVHAVALKRRRQAPRSAAWSAAFASALVFQYTALAAGAAHDSGPGRASRESVRSGTQPTAAAASDGEGGAIIAWSDRRSGLDRDIYAQRVTAPTLGRPAVAQWKDNGVPVCTVPGDQDTVVVVSDGHGGAILAWRDARSETTRVYAQHIDRDGTPQWHADGIRVGGPAEYEQQLPTLCTDGVGGAIVVWRDSLVRAQHLSATGELLWGPDAIEVTNLALQAGWIAVAPDDSGGAIIAWVDWAGTPLSMRLNRVDAAGNRRWGEAGLALASPMSEPYFPAAAAAPDGAGGLLLSWRNLAGDVVAQHVAPDGSPSWTAPGVVALPHVGAFNRGRDAIVSDGAGGAIVAASGRVQRVDGSGLVAWGVDGVSLLQAPSDVSFSSAIPDGGGGAIVAWGANVQRVDANGVPQWPANGTTLTIWPRDPGNEMVPTPGGGAILAWKDDRAFDHPELVLFPQVYAQELGSDGTARWTANGVPVYVTAGKRRSPVCVADGSGGAVNVWQEKRGGIFSIMARRVDAANQPLWPAVVCAEAEGSQDSPSAISDGVGGVVISWVDHRAAKPRLYGQRLAPDGARLWGDAGVAVSPESNAIAPSGIVPDGAGGMVACWLSDAIYGIVLQRITGEGAVYWPADGISVAIPYGARPGALASDGTGGAFLVWNGDPASGPLQAQRVDGTGQLPWGPAGVTVSPATNQKYEPKVVPDGSGGAILVWVNEVLNSSTPYAQALDSSGGARWPSDGVALISGVNFASQQDLRLVSDGAGGAIASWTDSRLLPNNYGQNGIYLQRVDHAGTVRWTPEGVPARASPFLGMANALLLSDGFGGAIASWNEQNFGRPWWTDEYAERVSSDGLVLWPHPSGICLFPIGTHELSGVAMDGTGGAYFAWEDSRDSTRDEVYTLRLTGTGAVAAGWDTDGATPVLASLVTTEISGGEVRLVWSLSSQPGEVGLERSRHGDGWTEIGRALPDGAGRLEFVDREPLPGERLGYRLTLRSSGREVISEEIWLEIPSLQFTLWGASPNPSNGDPLRLRFSLGTGDAATLELYDLAGRQLATRDLSGLKPGPQEFSWDVGARPAAGIYLVRLRQRTQSVTRRVLILR